MSIKYDMDELSYTLSLNSLLHKASDICYGIMSLLEVSFGFLFYTCCHVDIVIQNNIIY